jgi:hypothetical protein
LHEKSGPARATRRPFPFQFAALQKMQTGFREAAIVGGVSAIISGSSTPAHQPKRSCTMTMIVNRLRDAAAKRAAYNTIVHEISAMPLDVAIDLGIFREDAHKIAYEAVYRH